MLIVSDGEEISDIIPDDESIRHIHIESGHTIGAKRNFGCGEARGQIVAHWDDDDWSAPGRLAEQVAMLQESGKAVAGYSTVLFTGPKGSWKYIGGNSYAVGTSLCYLKDWWKAHQFNCKQVGEDTDFVHEAARHKQLVVKDGREMVVASIHPQNTSPRTLTGSQWERIAKLPETGFVYAG